MPDLQYTHDKIFSALCLLRPEVEVGIMTVAELIEKLKDFDQETQVAAWDEYCDCIYIQKIFLDYDYKTGENVIVLKGW